MNNRPERLSGGFATFLYKYGFTTYWVGTCAFGVIQSLDSAKGVLVMSLMAGCGLLYLLWAAATFATVDLEGDALRIRTSFKDLRAPLSEVSHFTTSSMRWQSLITIHFKRGGAFGKHAKFLITEPHARRADTPLLVDRLEALRRAAAGETEPGNPA